MATDFRVGSTNNTITVRVREDGEDVDISGVTSKIIRLKKRGVSVSQDIPAQFVTDGTDALLLIYRDFVEGVDEGEWQGEVYLGGLGIWSGPTEGFTFIVKQMAYRKALI